MASTIKNLDKQLLIIPLNSGRCVYLAPGETSAPIDDYEVVDNPKITKLAKASLIALSQASTAEAGTALAKTEKGRQPKKIQ